MQVQYRHNGIIKTINVQLEKVANVIKTLIVNGCDVLRVGA